MALEDNIRLIKKEENVYHVDFEEKNYAKAILALGVVGALLGTYLVYRLIEDKEL